MQKIQIGQSPLFASWIAYGCWRIANSGNDAQDRAVAQEAVAAALESGYTLFDLADIYCGGRSESIFGRLLREMPELKGTAVISTKCGIRVPNEPTAGAPYRYDASATHIVASCEGSLKRLGVETIDLYQIHRPDYLMDAEEIAEAFAKLESAGKVRAFGVSNFRASQVSLLQSAVRSPLAVNQIEISLMQLAPFDDGTLDQCQRDRVTPLAWSPLGGGLLGGGASRLLPAQERYRPDAVVGELDKIAAEHGATRVEIALAWLLRHPSKIIPIIGSVQPERIKTAAAAAKVELTREEWYRLLESAIGGRLP